MKRFSGSSGKEHGSAFEPLDHGSRKCAAKHSARLSEGKIPESGWRMMIMKTRENVIKSMTKRATQTLRHMSGLAMILSGAFSRAFFAIGRGLSSLVTLFTKSLPSTVEVCNRRSVSLIRLQLTAVLMFALCLPTLAPAAQFEVLDDLVVGDGSGGDTLSFGAGAMMTLPTTLGTVTAGGIKWDAATGLIQYWNGSANVWVSSTTHSHNFGTSGDVVCTNCVDMPTETTGNYIASITGNAQIGVGSVPAQPNENVAVTLSITADSITATQLADTLTLDNTLAIAGPYSFVVNNAQDSAGTFQVKSQGQTHMLFVDAANNRVGISSSAPVATLGVGGTILSSGSITAQGGFIGNGSALTNVTAADLVCTTPPCIGSTEIGDGLNTTNIDEAVFQQRVTGTCSAGSTIRSIAQDGTVTCESNVNDTQDIVVGNEVVGATDNSLTRSALEPYTLALNMANSNTWTANQIFNGKIGISSATPAAKLGVNGDIIALSSITAQGGFYGDGSNITGLNASNFGIGIVPVARGGTGADLSGAGGANMVVKQAGSGAAFTVGLLTTAEIPNLDTSKITSGTLGVDRGGTGATTFTSGRVLFGAGTGALNTSANLYWDNTASRLGISSATPAAALGVQGGVIALSSITAQGGFYGSGANVTNLNASNFTTGTLPLARGGTNATLTAANGAIAYSNATALALLAPGVSGQLLTSGGAGAPTWTSQSALTVNTATNLAGGSLGTVPYQSAPSVTAMLAVGTPGQLLQSNGAAAPSWITPSGGGSAVGTGRSITAGSGLSGGGDLSANRTISLNLGSANTWTAVQTFSGGITCTDCIALGSETSGNYAGSPTEGGKAINLDMPDTRAVATTPSTYSQEAVFNFKSGGTIGLPSGGFAAVLGVAPWTDDSGGGNHELAFGNGTDTLYYRYGTRGGGWGSWRAMIHSGNFNTYSPTLTGTGASGTWGINITGTASGAPPTGAAGGALTGTYPNPTLVLDSVNGEQLADNITLDANLNIDANTLVVDMSNNRVGIGTAGPANALDVAGVIRGQASAGAGDVLIVGNDSKLVDINVANTMGLYGMSDSTRGHLKLGSAGPTISGVSGNVGISSAVPAATLGVGGSIVASGNITSQGTAFFGTSGSYNVAANGAATLLSASVGNLQNGSGVDWFFTKTAWSGSNDANRIRFSTGSATAANTLASISGSGQVRARGSIIGNTAPDLAEYILAKHDVEAFDLVSVSDQKVMTAGPGGETVMVEKSQSPYDERIIGVISDGSSAFLVNSHMKDVDKEHPGKPLVLAGRFPVKVTLENGPVQRGDYLTSSSKPGYAMKATEPGPTVGIALEDFNGGTEGKVLCYVDIGERNVSALLKNLQSRKAALEAKNRELRARLAEVDLGAVKTMKAELIDLRRRMETLEKTRKPGTLTNWQ